MYVDLLLSIWRTNPAGEQKHLGSTDRFSKKIRRFLKMNVILSRKWNALTKDHVGTLCVQP